ncbi:hypothetical protein [Nonomuraea sp. NPDC050643]|uniref:hypothetical protein n=1 Tax=Nonomuraea sp. NPDC050643 TaxID=3155660 RepID=UPI0033D6ED1F
MSYAGVQAMAGRLRPSSVMAKPMEYVSLRLGRVGQANRSRAPEPVRMSAYSPR